MAYGGGFGRGGGFRRRFDGPRDMHKITCSECGKEGEVPFKPAEGKPVFCKDCFMKKKGLTPREKPKEEKSEEADVEDISDESEEESEDEEEY